MAWLAPVGLTLAMWGMIGYVRPITEWFRQRGILSNAIWGVFAVGVLAFANLWHSERRTAQDQSRGETWRGLAVLMGGLGVYLWAMIGLVVAPEERIHFVLVGLVTYLYYRAFRTVWPKEGWVPVLTFLAGIAVGGIEEWLQKLYPTRYFDWRDVGLNGLAAFLATAMIYLLLDRWRPTATTRPNSAMRGGNHF